MEPYIYIFTVLIAVFIAYGVAKSAIKYFTRVWIIWDYQTCLHYRHGKLVEVLGQ